MNDNFRYLSVGLPEDILRRKLHGDFGGALRLIDLRLKSDIPEALRKCLLVERELIRRLPFDYPYSFEQALAVIREDIEDFTAEEFLKLVDENKIDWIYNNGEPRYFNRFYQTLIKVNADFAKRAGRFTEPPHNKETMLLEDAISDMKQKGSCGRHIRLKASVKIKDEAFEPGKTVRVHIPVPAGARQVDNIKICATFPEASFTAPENAPQRTVYFEEKMFQNHEFSVEYEYDIVSRYTEPDPSRAIKEQPCFDTCEVYPHIRFTPYIKELAADLTKGETNPLINARAFYDFITLNVKYSYMREYFCLENIAENCARNFRGDCGVQALLFITLCRCAGIPAKWQSGLIASPYHVGPHDWAEFYVEPFGWLFADPSFGGGSHRSGAEHRREFYFGNLDPYRMIANSEFQAPFIPDKAYYRCDPYDNQTGEIELEDRGLLYNEYERRQEMLEIRTL
ncbi:MAG: Transglutaminase-like superfamily protein [Firmicutes bacterium ADurb.Bin182]|nr:MAG: Transglutaminase-like superfamily protein [Firmicutes bacterium ADurb.Bin182]